MSLRHPIVGWWYGCSRNAVAKRLLVEDLERRVLAALELVADDRHLGTAVLVAQERAAHARRLDRAPRSQRRGGDGLVVVGAVEPRGGVEPRAERLEDGRHRVPFARSNSGVPLNIRCSSSVRRARVADRLVAAADVVHDRERHDGRTRFGEQQDAKPVCAHPELAEAGLLLDELEGAARGRRLSRVGCRVGGGAQART
jgi:hypothetical protein